jgi:hypothetical protein
MLQDTNNLNEEFRQNKSETELFVCKTLINAIEINHTTHVRNSPADLMKNEENRKSARDIYRILTANRYGRI